ncbi:pyridoxal 5'-phosphate synthase glutaminase subunit PdxT [Patescibacteria group bacterium]
MTIGVLALQGAFFEHVEMLKRLNVEAREVRQKKDLDGLSGLIIPGGESTTISLLMKNQSLRDELIKAIEGGLPVYGTCAGAILLSKKVEGKKLSERLSVMDIEIERNAYGSQLDSFEEDLVLNLDGEERHFYAIFIRAPKITGVGENIDVLAKNSMSEIVMAREKNMLVTTFHPELTDDSGVHQYFLKMCEKFTQNL